MKTKTLFTVLSFFLCFGLTFSSIAHALAVPKPEARGVTISGSRVVAAGVATAAAVFNQPDQWGVTSVELSSEERGKSWKSLLLWLDWIR
ncbi:hypothetical protein [Dethiobacter alkaliphilus]|uniref:Uncharacterized protein n=1 Tax=Dethiobacter alkaliphilus AHT 1 TaxID=555088 RepID=C0GD62_DETAL|nr:hypothetical protein [Dethiobacter alkaliphilus]EEG78583.1 hypothetical protein DealDRAFT_0513 [Dethiobacter alkaliphilus AHT 1]